MAILQYLVAFVASRPKAFKLLAIVFVGVLAPLVVVGNLAHGIRDGGFFWDDAILLWIHGFSTPALDRFLLFVTQGGRALFAVPFCLFVTVYVRQKRRLGDAVFFGVATFGIMFLSLATKVFFGRDRPTLWVSPAPETTFSFPSGHAMGTMAIAYALIVLLWPTKWRWWALGAGSVYVLLVGLSRLYLGVHYPTDILAGWCAAFAWVAAVNSTIDLGRDGYLRRGWAYMPILGVLFRRVK